MVVIETERLRLRHLGTRDAEFILRLVSDPSWLRNIGDKGVRTVKDAAQYIENGPVAMYRRFGFGLYLVELKDVRTPLGICGLIKRESLPDVDLGLAFLPEFWGKGYAYEAAAASMEHAGRVQGLARLVAVTAPGNHRSGRLLEKLEFSFERMVCLAPHGEELMLYAATV